MVALLSAAAGAQTFVSIVTEPEITAVTGRADYDVGELAVGPTGVIYTVDTDEVGNERILRIVPGAPNFVEILTTENDIVAAVEAVNGTSVATDFTTAAIDVAADGDIIVAGDNTGEAATLVSVTDSVPGVIAVVHTSVNGQPSSLEGISSMTVLGNTAHIARNDEDFGADDVVSVDTEASGPQAAVATLVPTTALQAVAGSAVDDVALLALTNDGTHLYGVMSDDTSSTDDIVRITAGGVVTVHIADADITADLSAQQPGTTDMGYNSVAIDSSGGIWLLNPFGDGPFDGSVVQVLNAVPPSGEAHGYPESLLEIDLGISGPFLAGDSLDHDPANGRLLFAEGTSESVVAVSESTQLPVALSGIWEE